jgi:hypothetical protein
LLTSATKHLNCRFSLHAEGDNKKTNLFPYLISCGYAIWPGRCFEIFAVYQGLRLEEKFTLDIFELPDPGGPFVASTKRPLEKKKEVCDGI